MTIAVEEMLPETRSDLIGAKIKQLQRIPSFNGEKRRLLNELEKMLNRSKYQAGKLIRAITNCGVLESHFSMTCQLTNGGVYSNSEESASGSFV